MIVSTNQMVLAFSKIFLTQVDEQTIVVLEHFLAGPLILTPVQGM